MANITLRELADKVKKMKHAGHDLQHEVSKDLTEDKGKMAEIHQVSGEGRTMTRHVKKDGKAVESSGSMDAQQTGLFEKAAKKAGDKNPTFTTTEMVAAQAGVNAKKAQGKLGESESPLNEKIKKSDDEHKANTHKLIDSVKRLTSGRRPDYDPYTDGKEVADKVRAMLEKGKLKKALKIDPKQVPGAKPQQPAPALKPKAPVPPQAAKPAAPAHRKGDDAPVIDYGKHNKPKNTEAGAQVHDYSKHPPAPPQAPLWQRRAQIQKYQNDKALAAKHPDVLISHKPPSLPSPSKKPKLDKANPTLSHDNFIDSKHLLQKDDPIESTLKHIDQMAPKKVK